MQTFLRAGALLLVSLFHTSILIGQHRCASHQVDAVALQTDMQYQQTRKYINTHYGGLAADKTIEGTIYIPVVFHVLYNEEIENISDAQIERGIEILNEDFSNTGLNQPDSNWPQNAAVDIQFYLADTDPNGNATSGITRTFTALPEFEIDNQSSYSELPNVAIKVTEYGGKDAWPSDQYMNVWVGDLSGYLAGFATFPGYSFPEYDGVVMDYLFVGDIGTGSSIPNFDKGRTMTHEVGHWLNLYHIWGDGDCSSDDLVEDTPLQSGFNSGCPIDAYSCASYDMTVNFMDYTFDQCMSVFTEGQKERMRAIFEPDGPRSSFMENQPDPPTYTAVNIWMDMNADGIRQSIDVPLPGVTVMVKDAFGNLLDSQITDTELVQISSDHIVSGNYIELSYDPMYSLTLSNTEGLPSDSDFYIDNGISMFEIDQWVEDINAGLVLYPDGTVPADLFLHCLQEVPLADPNAISGIIGNDVSVSVSDEQINDASACQGDALIIKRNYLLVDAYGLESELVQWITVEAEGHWPTIQIEDIEVQSLQDVPSINEIFENLLDECGTSMSWNSASFDNGGSGVFQDPLIVTETFDVYQCNGDVNSYTRLINIEDTMAPVVTLLNDLTVSCKSDLPQNPLTLIEEIIDLHETTVTFSSYENNGLGNTQSPFEYTIVFDVVDEGGLQTQVSHKTIVIDDTLPSYQIEGPIFLLAESHLPAHEEDLLVEYSDNCETPSLVTTTNSNEGSGNLNDPLLLNYQYTIDDNHGNTVTFEWNIHVEDIYAHHFIGETHVQSFTLVPPEKSEIFSGLFPGCPMSLDVKVEESISGGDGCYGHPSFVNRTYTVTDCFGNENMYQETIRIEDTEAPLASIEGDMYLNCISDLPPINTDVLYDVIDHNDSSLSIESIETLISEQSSPFDETIIQRRFILEDCGGLQSEYVQHIYVQDVEAPFYELSNDKVYFFEEDLPMAISAFVVDSGDDCANHEISIENEIVEGTGAYGDPMIIETTCYFTDAYGNQSLGVVTSRIENPVSDLMNLPTKYFELEQDIPADLTLEIASRNVNCETEFELLVHENREEGSACFGDAVTFTREYVLLDCFGNEVSFTERFVIEDKTPPTAIIQEDLYLECVSEIPDLTESMPSSFQDNYDPNPSLEMMEEIVGGTGNSADPLIINHVYTLTDCGGLSSTYTRTFTIIDTEEPYMNPIADTTVAYLDQIPNLDISMISDVWDNCNIETLVLDYTDQIISGTGSFEDPMYIQRNVILSDENQNVFETSYIITVQSENVILDISQIELWVTFEDDQVQFDWEVKQAIPFARFELEWSDNSANSFSSFYTKVSDPSISKYYVQDYFEQYGQIYFRVKGIEEDGTLTYSNIVSFNREYGEVWNVNLYPNPASDFLTVYQSTLQKTRVYIYDATFKLIQKTEFSENEIGFDVSAYPTGLYYLQIITDKNEIVKKIMIE